MAYCPEDVFRIFEEKFNFPQMLLFGVVSTCRDKGVSNRMMRIYDFKNGQPILLTHTHSEKWRELSAFPKIAICFVSDDKMVQIIMRGKVNLETKKTAPHEASKYWETIRPDVKLLYDPLNKVDLPYQQTPPLTAPVDVPETSGMIVVFPEFWEVLKLTIPYTDSIRLQFQMSTSGWEKQRVCLG